MVESGENGDLEYSGCGDKRREIQDTLLMDWMWEVREGGIKDYASIFYLEQPSKNRCHLLRLGRWGGAGWRRWQVSQQENQKFHFCICLRWILGITALGQLIIKLNFLPVSNPFSKY